LHLDLCSVFKIFSLVLTSFAVCLWCYIQPHWQFCCGCTCFRKSDCPWWPWALWH